MLVETQETLYLPAQIIQPERRARKQQVARRNKGLVIALVLLAFALGMVWTTQSIWLVLKGYELAQLKKEISTLQQANERLQLEVARLKSPEHVAQVATTKLGMVKPTYRDIRFLPDHKEERIQLAQEVRPTLEEQKNLHPLWVKVAEVLQSWLVVNRPAQAAHR